MRIEHRCRPRRRFLKNAAEPPLLSPLLEEGGAERRGMVPLCEDKVFCEGRSASLNSVSRNIFCRNAAKEKRRKATPLISILQEEIYRKCRKYKECQKAAPLISISRTRIAQMLTKPRMPKAAPLIPHLSPFSHPPQSARAALPDSRIFSRRGGVS